MCFSIERSSGYCKQFNMPKTFVNFLLDRYLDDFAKKVTESPDYTEIPAIVTLRTPSRAAASWATPAYTHLGVLAAWPLPR
jgi:hypothetical protein